MRKWRDMDRQMEPSSQMFTQGGIRSRDWFSDRLQQGPGGATGGGHGEKDCEEAGGEEDQGTGPRWP